MKAIEVIKRHGWLAEGGNAIIVDADYPTDEEREAMARRGIATPDEISVGEPLSGSEARDRVNAGEAVRVVGVCLVGAVQWAYGENDEGAAILAEVHEQPQVRAYCEGVDSGHGDWGWELADCVADWQDQTDTSVIDVMAVLSAVEESG